MGASSGHKNVLSIEDGMIPGKKNIQYMPTRVETADLPAKSTRLRIDQWDDPKAKHTKTVDEKFSTQVTYGRWWESSDRTR